jgi:hypothetical protein
MLTCDALPLARRNSAADTASPAEEVKASTIVLANAVDAGAVGDVGLGWAPKYRCVRRWILQENRPPRPSAGRPVMARWDY